MKKLFLNIVLPIVLPLLAVLAIGPGCGPGTMNPPNICDRTNTKFMALYNTLGTDLLSSDKTIHEYTFTSNVPGTVCAIGYQGMPNLSGLANYRIQLINASTNIVKHDGEYSFDATARSYYDISPVAITANTAYIIRRTVIDDLGNIGNTQTHLKQIPAPFAPIVLSPITITQTISYEKTGGQIFKADTNSILPCIDFVFTPN